MMRFLSKSWAYFLIAFAYIALNLFLIFQYEFYWLLFLPVLAVVFYWAFFSLDTLLGFIVVCTPLSFSLLHGIGGIGMYLPTDPLMVCVMLIFFLKLIMEQHFDGKILRHPVTIIILLQIAWMLITACSSTMPVVSFKFFTSRLWYVVCFYFLATQLFKNRKNLVRFHWWYVIPLTAVIIYTLIHHSYFNFSEKTAHWVMEPFFKDHTIYGAIVAFFIPSVIFLLQKKYDSTIKIATFFIFIVFAVGIVLSYTRAAWLSLAGALVLFFIYKLKIKFRTLATVIVIIGGIIFFSWHSIVWKLDANHQDSSTNFENHLQSMYNVSTDASNLERINRWMAAWGMFQKHPVLGWGPGTYAFQYAPFQLPQYKTTISTNDGNRGNAHSEYLGPLAEQGVLGSLLFIALLIVVFYRGSNLYHRLPKGDLKNLVLTLLLGLATYFIHGTLNNYLTSDKASVAFWGFIAMLVAIEVYHEKEEQKSIESSNDIYNKAS